jgi:hypothetical protein
MPLGRKNKHKDKKHDGHAKGDQPAVGNVDDIDMRELATEFGFSYTFLKSVPELRRAFEQAVSDNWTPARFVAEVRSTKWFANNSESRRKYAQLKSSDPGTLRDMMNETRASVRDMAVEMGAQVPDSLLTRISKNVLRFGLNDAQIRDTLAGAVKMGAKDTYGGQAAANVAHLESVARANGVRLSDKTMQGWAVRLAAGESIEGFDAYVRGMAKQAYPAFAAQLDAGQNVEDIADPYRQQMARTLELNPEDIDLFDPTLRKALQAATKDGQVALKPMWKWEQELRHDPRFDKTQTARGDAAQFATTFLKSFGAV